MERLNAWTIAFVAWGLCACTSEVPAPVLPPPTVSPALATPAARPLELEVLSVTELKTNCYIVSDPATGQALVIDPGGDAARILAALERHGLSVSGIALTHNHFDHAGAAWALQQATHAPLYTHAAQATFREAGLATDLSQLRTVLVTEGSVLGAGGFALHVLETPGHAPGSLCFYDAARTFVLTGDLLFRGSVGRTDFPGSSAKTLQASLARLAQKLPATIRVLPGHGPATTLAWELAHNPFLGL